MISVTKTLHRVSCIWTCEEGRYSMPGNFNPQTHSCVQWENKRDTLNDEVPRGTVLGLARRMLKPVMTTMMKHIAPLIHASLCADYIGIWVCGFLVMPFKYTKVHRFLSARCRIN